MCLMIFFIDLRLMYLLCWNVLLIKKNMLEMMFLISVCVLKLIVRLRILVFVISGVMLMLRFERVVNR